MHLSTDYCCLQSACLAAVLAFIFGPVFPFCSITMLLCLAITSSGAQANTLIFLSVTAGTMNVQCCFADNPTLDRLAQLESEFGKLPPAKGDEEAAQKKRTEDGEEVEDEPVEEDEDDFQDDDDYYQVIALILSNIIAC